jgi:hypothetical protein
MKFSRPSHATVVAYLSLFLVLTGGTALAVDGSLPGQNTVGSADIINGEVQPDDIKADSIGSAKIAPQSVKNSDLGLGASSSNTIADGGIEGIDVKNGTLGSLDLATNSIGFDEIEQAAVRSEEVEDGSLTGDDIDDDTISGADIYEYSLGQVPDADTVDGRNSDLLAPPRIHAVGDLAARRYLIPNLGYSVYCGPPAGYMYVTFYVDDVNLTANSMTVGSGIETPVTQAPDTIILENGATIEGFAFGGDFDVLLQDTAGAGAAAETQLIIDGAANTYSVALHMYERQSDGYCEAFGTVTLSPPGPAG